MDLWDSVKAMFVGAVLLAAVLAKLVGFNSMMSLAGNTGTFIHQGGQGVIQQFIPHLVHGQTVPKPSADATPQ